MAILAGLAGLDEDHDTICDHRLHGVTPEMIDWWWDNMEKGYQLWCLEEHFSFKWQISPAKNGHVGSIQLAEESINFGPVRVIPIRWSDFKETPQCPQLFEHCLVSSTPGSGRYLAHQYEKTYYGSFLRSWTHRDAAGPRAEAWAKHNELETSYFEKFLPQLYKMWQSVTDPKINVPCCLKVPYKDINKPR
jgi:hypothetical protein